MPLNRLDPMRPPFLRHAFLPPSHSSPSNCFYGAANCVSRSKSDRQTDRQRRGESRLSAGCLHNRRTFFCIPVCLGLAFASLGVILHLIWDPFYLTEGDGRSRHPVYVRDHLVGMRRCEYEWAATWEGGRTSERARPIDRGRRR